MPYFDANATAPLHSSVLHMLREATGAPRNPSSPHRYGRDARKILERARASVRSAVDAGRGTRLIFVSGGTEANNMALRSFGFDAYLVCATDHPSVLAASPEHKTDLIPVDRHGYILPDALEQALTQRRGKVLVAVAAANNETGVVQKIAPIVDLCRRYGASIHCDATQAFGKIPFSMHESGVDFMTISAHKAGGLPGVGALLFPEHLMPQALVKGGGQERGARSGTENVLAAEAFGVIADHIETIRQEYTACAPIRDAIERALPGVTVACGESERLPNTSCLVAPGKRGYVRMGYLDAAGFAVSLGSACSSGRASDSHVLKACGYTPEERESAIRISLPACVTQAEADEFVSVWRRMEAKRHVTSL